MSKNPPPIGVRKPARVRAIVERFGAELASALADDAPAAMSRWMRLADSPVVAIAQKWIAAGELPSCKPGKQRLIDRAVHDALCEKHSRAKQVLPRSIADNDAPELDEELLHELRATGSGR